MKQYNTMLKKIYFGRDWPNHQSSPAKRIVEWIVLKVVSFVYITFFFFFLPVLFCTWISAPSSSTWLYLTVKRPFGHKKHRVQTEAEKGNKALKLVEQTKL